VQAAAARASSLQLKVEPVFVGAEVKVASVWLSGWSARADRDQGVGGVDRPAVRDGGADVVERVGRDGFEGVRVELRPV